MNTLTTRKFVLGMLMTLVLAFSVQGIADALTFSTSRSGDLETKAANQEFTVRFSVSLKGNTAIRIGGNLVKDSTSPDPNHRIDSSGYKVFEADDEREYRISTAASALTGTNVRGDDGTYSSVDGPFYVNSSKQVVDEKGDPVYQASDTDNGISDTNRKRATADPDAKVDDQFRYHYNQEAIQVDLTGPAEIIKVGSRNVNITEDEDLDMYERTHPSYEGAADHEKLSGSVTLVLQPTGAGVVTIRVDDETPDTTDAPTNGKSDPITFTLYVVNYNLSVRTSALAFTGLRGENYTYAGDQFDSPVGFSVTSEPSGNAPIKIEVVEGPGRLYIQKTYTVGDFSGSPRSLGRAAKEIDISSAVGSETTATTGGQSSVHLDAGGGTNRITITAPGHDPVTAIFVYGRPEIQIVSGDDQTGATEGRLEDPLVVKVVDQRGRGVPMAIVTFGSNNATDEDERFLPVPGTTVHVDDVAPVANWASVYADIGNINRPVQATSLYPMTASDDIDADVVVQTDRNGEAQVYFQLGGTVGGQNVTVRSVGASETFRTTAVDASRSASLVLVSGDNQRSDPNTHDVEDPLVVRARRVGGYRISNVIIRFTALTGVLEPAPGTVRAVEKDDDGSLTTNTIGPTSGQEIFVMTNAHGEAGVIYNAGQITGAKTITARVDDEQATTQYDFQIRQVEFNIDGGGSTTTPTPPTTPTTPTTPTLSVPSSVTGAAGDTATLAITASAGTRVSVGSILNDSFITADGTVVPSTFTGSRTVSLTLPDAVGTYQLSVFGVPPTRTVTVTVTEATAQQPTGGRLEIDIEPFSSGPGTESTVTVRAFNEDGAAAANVLVTLSVSSGAGILSNTSVTTRADGTVSTRFVRGSTPGNSYYITARATGYTDRNAATGNRVVITGTAPPPTTTTPTPSSTAAYLDLDDGDDQTGELNRRLANPLVVQVLDEDEDPVEDAIVTFVVTEGSGQFRPLRPRTDEDGYATTRFTPRSTGEIRVRATVEGVDDPVTFTVFAGETPEALVKISGDNQNGTPGSRLANPFVVEVQDADGEPIAGHRVTFAVTAGGGSLSETGDVTDEDGRAETTLTLGSERGVNSVQASVADLDPVTFNTSVEPTILVAAANRPVMYWIDGGMLYRLADAKAEQIAASANNVAVDTAGGKIYWTAQTGERAGVINSANLDGTNVETVKETPYNVPLSIAVDSTGGKLYWIDSRDKIRSINLDGTGGQDVLPNLPDPKDIALSSSNAYWTEGAGSIRRVNLTGRKITIEIATGLGTLGGLAVSGNKVYWTEDAGDGTGGIYGANLDGNNVQTVKATPYNVPLSLAVDSEDGKLYWIDSKGRIRSSNLNGGKVQDVVEGLISPSTLAIGGANVASDTAPGAKSDTAAKSKYDVNGDGSVDNVDVGLVAAALFSGNPPAKPGKLDVNGDGTLNIQDLVAVSQNVDNSAAAPTLRAKLTSVQIDRIQEQIDLLLGMNDRSPGALYALQYLQSLLAVARPEKTQLLANYPNPFNPETWIPYELATDTNVQITIYDAQGVIIRTLSLGHQSAGYYTGRDRAAYWDGRNSLGELVASGLYFYQFETDTMSLMRKMVILK